MEQSYTQIMQYIIELNYSQKKRLLKDIKKMIVKQKDKKIPKDASWLGCLSHKTRIPGDIISPVVDEGCWEVLSS